MQMPQKASCNCTPTDPCEIPPGTCLPGGGCQGVPVNVTGIIGPCIVEQGIPASFSAQSNVPGKVKWTASGGTPATGQGPSFSVQFGGPGNYAVTAFCKTSDSKMIDVVVSCPATYSLDVFKATPAQQSAYGWTGYTVPRPDVLACARGIQGCVAMSAYHQGEESVVPASIPGKTDLADANDLAINAGNCTQVITDFTPFDPCQGPHRTKFWSRTITLGHEKTHYDQVRTDVIEKTAREFDNYLKSACVQCLNNLPPPAQFFQKLRQLFEANRLAYEAQKECTAHGVSNPDYVAFVAGIRQRAQREGWQQCR
jgi:hypothetical protein